MDLLLVLFGIIILLILILKKVSPMLALLIVAVATGLMLGLPVETVMNSVSKGIGSTMGDMVMVLALGAMVGKLAEDSGAAKKIVFVLVRIFGIQNIQWAVLLTGILVGIPLFYNAGFVVLIPLVFTIASAAKLPKLYVGIPMAAALSITHGFLPPHPGPVALASIFHADIGRILIYGLIISIPVAIIAGIFFPRAIIKLPKGDRAHQKLDLQGEENLPSALKSFIIALSPIFFIVVGTVGVLLTQNPAIQHVLTFIANPTVALTMAVLITITIQRMPMEKAMDSCVEGVKSIAMIILIIAAGGAFKQILVDSGIGEQVKTLTGDLNVSPLILGWLIAALLRVTLGSATVAALTASGMVIPFITAGASPELMVLAVGAGSLMLSHVNDTGFWMFKEYFNLSLKETFKTWTVMESLVSVLGLAGVLLLSQFV
ncbi:gluconate:H+ symporter [Pedobacter cryoconitis]|uniref:Gnt-I system high-affinity gluconate transporter n=1 Tax=Pedobacter cryoconitis TaxID=188932 RepID=A0A327T9D7_9SPHI|nr:gluconate:H+ symporter [Pedobacter cryoconitis]RAJ36995.1 Gnt-I system high-affinity gluconate transporter [Pedobacter cryoconitis]